MLIEFSVENYRSIQEKQTLSMVASDDETILDSNTFPTPNNDDLRLVKSAVIYGPNASGKSNLLRAIDTLRYLVINSATRMQLGHPLPIEPFILNSESAKQPSIFEVIFIHKGMRYEYGISLNQERIYEEWLIAYPNERQQNWLSRKYLPDNPELQADEGYEWTFGRGLKGEKKIIRKFVRSNSLFLSHAAQNNHPQLREIFEYFRDKMNILGHRYTDIGFPLSLLNKNSSFKEKVAKLIAEADIGISDIKIQIDPGLTSEELSKMDTFSLQFISQKADFQYMAEETIDTLEEFDIITIHKMNDSEEEIEFDIADESTGTKRLFEIAAYWLYALQNGEVILVDEIDTSLHPVLSIELVKMFNDPEINKNNAQLIFTTHDTTLLDEEIFRKDQVWFTEKDKSMTKLYSLLGFRPREDESLQKGYLLGRYGAIPFINGLSI
ncbi:AAA family ATPase [Cylindrospermum sp. FACHB-282]|uniref:AAA family ATPase n=1 Tax=Cylindrospermum sp. FACHB-282 TaxID=2692794 RepID=UPI001687BCB6|nr:ATP-binding protein [Cylindrospermum sp. FACHB-282]MBD2385697.1 ATP-binding protein [Cylindrospermum sp. FACHB-282]